MQLHAALEGVGRLAVLVDAHVAGRDAFHAAFVVVQNFGGGEARERSRRPALRPAGRASGTTLPRLIT